VFAETLRQSDRERRVFDGCARARLVGPRASPIEALFWARRTRVLSAISPFADNMTTAISVECPRVVTRLGESMRGALSRSAANIVVAAKCRRAFSPFGGPSRTEVVEKGLVALPGIYSAVRDSLSQISFLRPCSNFAVPRGRPGQRRRRVAHEGSPGARRYRAVVCRRHHAPRSGVARVLHLIGGRWHDQNGLRLPASCSNYFLQLRGRAAPAGLPRRTNVTCTTGSPRSSGETLYWCLLWRP